MKKIDKTDEMIDYDLSSLPTLDISLKGTVIETLKRLPEDVYDFAINSIVFLSSKGSQMINVKQVRKWKRSFVVLLEENESQDGVAHEIAHAYLNHELLRSLDECDQEKEANELIKKWGFAPISPTEEGIS